MWTIAGFIVLFSLLLTQCVTENKLGLYDRSDCVIILDNKNFYKNLIGSDSVWIVEFYNSWCGHCIKFAPKWKDFAKEHTGWRPVIKIGAVDCADSNNTDICRTYDIKAFPDFKIFPPYATVHELGETHKDQNLDSVRKKLLDFASNTTDPPDHWPKLSPIKLMQDIWDEAKDTHHHVAFVFEEEDSYVGREILSNWKSRKSLLFGNGLTLHHLTMPFGKSAADEQFCKNSNNMMLYKQTAFEMFCEYVIWHLCEEVILDTFQYSQLLVRRMIKDDVKKFVITKFPSIYLINRDGTFTQVAKGNNSKSGMVKALKDLLTAEQLAAGDQFVKKIEMELAVYSREPEQVIETGTEKAGVYMQDLESTLHFMFRQEIAIHRTIEDDKVTALKDFINVLAKYFPGRKVVTDYLQILNNWLKGETELTGDHWLNHVEELQTVDKYLPDRVEWVCCQGSQLRYRGYPCGMWTLFHTLTVSGLQTQRQNPKDVPLDILGAIKEYMKHFFGCQVCVHHFLVMADKITSADKRPDGAVVWLWKAHNQANARLHGDASEDPKHPKVQFPPKNVCENCYHGDRMDEKKVFDFLVTFYGKEGIISPLVDSEERDVGKAASEGEAKGLDWWELQQRRKDLEKIKSLRSLKMDKLKQKKERLKYELAVVKERSLDFEDYKLEAKSKQIVLSGWGFNNIDMGMCVVFYLMCTCILIILYYHFIVRRKFRPLQFLLPK